MSIRNVVIIVCVLALSIVLPSWSSPAQDFSSGGGSIGGNVEVSAQQGQANHVEMQASAAGADSSARGWLRLRSADGSVETKVDLVYLRVDGEYAWAAGECTEDTDGLQGRWLFIALHDGGKPGRLVDQLWMEWLDEGAKGRQQAKSKVDNLETPAESESIESGDLKVKD